MYETYPCLRQTTGLSSRPGSIFFLFLIIFPCIPSVPVTCALSTVVPVEGSIWSESDKESRRERGSCLRSRLILSPWSLPYLRQRHLLDVSQVQYGVTRNTTGASSTSCVVCVSGPLVRVRVLGEVLGTRHWSVGPVVPTVSSL